MTNSINFCCRKSGQSKCQIQIVLAYSSVTGGLPDLSEIDPEAMEEDPTAYEGCLRGLHVNGRTYQLNEIGRGI